MSTENEQNDLAQLSEARRRFPKGSTFKHSRNGPSYTSTGWFEWRTRSNDMARGISIMGSTEPLFVWINGTPLAGPDWWAIPCDTEGAPIVKETTTTTTTTAMPKEIGVKYNEGKPKLSLLMRQFPDAMRAIVTRAEYGHQKYLKYDANYDNWRNVDDPINTYVDAGLRHLTEHVEGKEMDENGQPHMWAAIWNMMAAGQLVEEERLNRD